MLRLSRLYGKNHLLNCQKERENLDVFNFFAKSRYEERRSITCAVSGCGNCEKYENVRDIMKFSQIELIIMIEKVIRKLE
jgi:hypothetical protein